MDDDRRKGERGADCGPVMVTGASGFVGRAIVEALRNRGEHVIALARSVPSTGHAGTRWIAADLLEPGAARPLFERYKPRRLIHAAWARSEGAGLWHLEANWAWRDASLGLFRDFWDATGGHVVACGTCAEYDPPSEGDCIEDVTPIRPSSTYGRAKAELADRAFEEVQRLGGSLTWARLFYLFGRHEDPARLVPHIIDRLLRGETAEIGSGRAVRDFAYMGDIADALAELAGMRTTGAVNVASGSGIEIAALARKVAAMVGGPGRLAIGALPDRPGEAGRIVADISRLRRTIGRTPTSELGAGLAATIESRRRIPL